MDRPNPALNSLMGNVNRITHSQKLHKKFVDYLKVSGDTTYGIDKETGINYRVLTKFKKGESGLNYDNGSRLLDFLKEKGK